MLRIDTHHHLSPPGYRNVLRKAGIDDVGGRALPDWSPEAALQAMSDLDVASAIVSVSAPGTTFLPRAAEPGGRRWRRSAATTFAEPTATRCWR